MVSADPPRRRGRAALAAATAVLALAGCAGAGPADPAGNSAEPLPVSWQRDAWLAEDYAQGFGEVWRPERPGTTICAIDDGVVLVEEPADGASRLRAERIGDGAEVWRIDDGRCDADHALGAAAVVIAAHADGETLERVEVATGERTVLAAAAERIELRRVLGEHAGTVLVRAAIDDTPMAFLALDGGEAPRWRDDALPERDFACRLLDGGAAAADSEPLLGCQFDDGRYAVLSTETGERIVWEPTADPRVRDVHWARNGWFAQFGRDDSGMLLGERFDLGGTSLGEGEYPYVRLLPQRAGLLVSADDFPAASEVVAVARDGTPVIRVVPGGGYAFAASDEPLRLEQSERIGTVSRDGTTVLLTSDTGMRLVDARGATIDEVGLEWSHRVIVLGGLIVERGGETLDDDGEAAIHLPVTR